MGKQIKGWDDRAGQFKVEVAGHKFYVGVDPSKVQSIKANLKRYRASIDGWDAESLTVAKAIAKGQTFRVPADADDAVSDRKALALAGAGVAIQPAITMADLQSAEVSILNERIAELEAELKVLAGPRVAVRSSITLVDVFNEWAADRKARAVYPGTKIPTDTAKNQSNVAKFVTGQIHPAGLKLADMDYNQIELLCLRIASRPKGARGKPISSKWTKECLKTIRRVIRWAVRMYGYRPPVEWIEATRHRIQWIKEDQLARQATAKLIYSPEEVRTLYRYSLPSERVLLMLGLNCGFRQREVTALRPDEIKGDHIERFRDKSDIFAVWQLWPETVTTLATPRPIKRGRVTSAWKRLLDRIQKDDPKFRCLSFKRLCKTGSGAMRRLAGGEIASMYLSHGQHTDDKLLGIYAPEHWQKLGDALNAWRDELALDQVATGNDRTSLPLSIIDQCKQMWRNGHKVQDIVTATGMSRATAYRYRLATVETADTEPV